MEEDLVRIFPLHLRPFCKACFKESERPEEIRMRIGQPLLLYTGSRELYWNEMQNCLQEDVKEAYETKERDFADMLAYMSNYSLYAFEEEIRGGFLTIQGGHRIGLAGKTVCERGIVKTIRQISFLNIRIAGERKGCADGVLPHIRNGTSIFNTLFISPPGIGKTTLLRDCIRQLSAGTKEFPGLKVGVVDERSEIAACYLGKPQNDLGPRTDVMDCCPKSEGMLLLLRSMSPEIIGVDELGGQADYEAVEYALHCGCHILGTMHGERIEDMKDKLHLTKWLEKRFFERYVFLNKKENKTRKFNIYDERLEQIC